MSAARQLSDIKRTAQEELDARAEHEEKRSRRSRWNGYEKTLRTVERTAGAAAMRTLASWIKNWIRERKAVPSTREVRAQGGRICRERGYEIEPNSWLDP